MKALWGTVPAVLLIGGFLLWWSGAYAPGPKAPAHRAVPAVSLSDPIRITVLGTSLTRNGDWPDVLARRLSACSQRSIAVTRVAKAGANSSWGIGQADTVAATRPDVVLIEFAINDADIVDGHGLTDARANHLALFDRLALLVPDARLVLMTTNTAHGLRGLVRPWLNRHYAGYRSLAKERDLGLIDIAPAWEAALSGTKWRTLMPDGLHPTDAAVESVALPLLTSELGLLLPGCH